MDYAPVRVGDSNDPMTNAIAYPQTGLLLSGGGARAAYQVGVLRSLARAYPQFTFPILTGVSAGAINAAVLANVADTFPVALERLKSHWESLTIDQVFHTSFCALATNMGRWIFRAVGGGSRLVRPTRGLVDTRPLANFLRRILDAPHGVLRGVEANLRSGRLSAVGIMTTSYPTAESVTWAQGGAVTPWRFPGRSGVATRLTVDHIMASAALPLIFPAAKLERRWHGDGGIRLTAPLSPAIQLGADRILAISTMTAPGASEADRPGEDYPPPATVMSVLLDSVFLDLLDCDAMELHRMNQLIAEHPRSEELGIRPVEVLVIRPSQDLGRLASEFEHELPRVLRSLIRALGSRQTNRSDLIATLLFQPGYIRRVIEIGERDGEQRCEEIVAFLGRTGAAARRQKTPAAA